MLGVALLLVARSRLRQRVDRVPVQPSATTARAIARIRSL
jgi:hypothetical protein